ncbi:MAG: formamidopyrimidine-DNA glycosylase [Parcubacteria group bacterium Licking1014_17]|nr:MAG: formamidopyrimidine-DNA glycosylase [Parcubacteria group bacterium Licking1014_17]
MPELPEVETIVRQLHRKARGVRITDIWRDSPKTIKGIGEKEFRRGITGGKITGVRRRAKYILVDLNNGKTIAVHQKISGHLLYGKWKEAEKGSKEKWVSAQSGPLANDPNNRYIRFIFFLNNGFMLALSDLRRFARIYLGSTDKIENISDIGKLGSEPLDKSFTLEYFLKLLGKKRGAIKKVLMDQYVISGIGNIYSDEILWHAGVHPLARVEKLSKEKLAGIYKFTEKVLLEAIKAKGTSESDYRMLNGEKGGYQFLEKAYHQTGKKCAKKDGGVISRLRLNGRSAHFCPVHQKK